MIALHKFENCIIYYNG